MAFTYNTGINESRSSCYHFTAPYNTVVLVARNQFKFSLHTAMQASVGASTHCIKMSLMVLILMSSTVLKVSDNYLLLSPTS